MPPETKAKACKHREAGELHDTALDEERERVHEHAIYQKGVAAKSRPANVRQQICHCLKIEG